MIANVSGASERQLKSISGEHGEKRCTSESFDSHGEHLQVTGSIPVQQIMFRCL